MPQVRSRYRTTGETAVVGESLAGLFVVETLLLEPDLFDTYIAFDPSLWWNDQRLLGSAAPSLRARPRHGERLYLASSKNEIAALTQRLARVLEESGFPGDHLFYQSLPNETHATIYHPAALQAFRQLFKPPAQP